MCFRPEIPFEDMLASLWSQAYGEIVSIVREKHLEGSELLWDKPFCNIEGIVVSSDGCLNFIDTRHHIIIAEDLPDEILFESYRKVYCSFIRNNK